MNLVIDIGNTCIKWGTIKDRTFTFGAAINHHTASLHNLLVDAWTGLEVPDRILVSNVTGKAFLEQLSAYVFSHWRKYIELMPSSDHVKGKLYSLVDPMHLGSDRWLGMLAAHRLYNNGACVINCGTCITLDVVSKDRKHLGGLIGPGWRLMCDSIVQRTTIPRIASSLEIPKKFGELTEATDDSVNHGTLYMIAALIKQMASSVNHLLDDKATFVISGGDAEIIIPLLNKRIEHHPHLVLHGLCALLDDEEAIAKKSNKSVELG